MNVRRSILLTVFLTGVGAVLSGAWWQLRSHPPERAEARPASISVAWSPAEGSALAVLRVWDRRRARAWAEGDVAGLGRLYTAGSRTGAADQAMLRTWSSRGLAVEGMRTQVLSADVRSHAADRITLVLTDRLAAATASGRDTRIALPRDQPTRHQVVLVRRQGTWLVQEVS